MLARRPPGPWHLRGESRALNTNKQRGTDEFRHPRTRSVDRVSPTGLVTGRNRGRPAPQGMPWGAPAQPSPTRAVRTCPALPGPSEAGGEGSTRAWPLHGAGSTVPRTSAVLTGTPAS